MGYWTLLSLHAEYVKVLLKTFHLVIDKGFRTLKSKSDKYSHHTLLQKLTSEISSISTHCFSRKLIGDALTAKRLFVNFIRASVQSRVTLTEPETKLT